MTHNQVFTGQSKDIVGAANMNRQRIGYQEMSKWVSVKCPYHDDTTASASLNRKDDRFKCHGCGHTTTAVKALKESGVSQVTTVSDNDILPTIGKGGNMDRPTPPTPKAKAMLQEATLRYHGEGQESQQLTDYLSDRGITPKTTVAHKLGIVTTPLPGHEQYRGRLTIPYLTANGTVGMRFRCLCSDCKTAGHPKYLWPTGQVTRMYGVLSVSNKNNTVIAITEGELDAISLHQVGVPAVGIPGANAWKAHYRAVLEDFPNVYVVGDGDKAGRAFTQTILSDIPDATPITPPEGSDINSLLTDQGQDAVIQLLGMSK